MANNNPILITDFTGQAENPHIGFGNAVGMDLYTTKGVARLSRKMQKASGTVCTDFPLYVTEANNGDVYVQGDTGVIYKGTTNASSWAVVAGGPTPAANAGRGIIVWEDYLFAMTPTDVAVYGPLSGSPSWDNTWWTSTVGNPALVNTNLTPHVPFINPALNFLYISNGRYVAYVQLNGPATTFDPTDATTFLTSNKAFIMPAYYIAQNIGFLPPKYTAIAVQNTMTNSQADVVIWDGTTNTTATNVVSLPGASGPVKQLLTRNGVLYGITNIEHGIYTINGSSATLVDRLGLRMSSRLITGEVNTSRVVSQILPNGADFLGPELLTAGCNQPQITSQQTNTGMFPYGVWSVNIEDQTIGLRFPLSFGDINALYTTTYKIGFIKTINDTAVIVGWAKGSTYGIDLLSLSDYITDQNTTFLESAIYEVGTSLNPRTFDQLEFNIIQPLTSGQQIQFYYRTSLANPYQVIRFSDASSAVTSVALGQNLSGACQKLPFQAVRYIQIATTFDTGSQQTQSPQIRSILLTNK